MKENFLTLSLISLITWGVTILVDFYNQVKTAGNLMTYLFKTKSEVNLMPYPFAIILVDVIVVAIYMIFNKRPYKSKSLLKKTHPSSLSKDKEEAMRPPVPKKLLSKEPKDLTVGTCGYFNKKYINIPIGRMPIDMVCVIGSPGSQKTTTTLNYSIDNFNFSDNYTSMLMVDCKPELTLKSVNENRKDIRIINPTSIESKWGFDVFYGLNSNSTDDELKTRASQIAHSIIPNLSGDNEHFSTNAQNMLIGFICYGFIKGKLLTDIISQILSVKIQDLIVQMIMDPDLKSHPKIINMVKQYEDNSSDEFKSIQDTLIKDLSIFENDSVKYCFAGNPNKVVPQDLIDGISISLAIPDYLMEEYKTVFGMIIEICIKYLMQQDEEIYENKKPIVFYLDESGTIYIHSLIDLLSKGRSRKLQTICIAQSFDQWINLYGNNNANTILNTCKIQIYFSCYDATFAKSLSDRSGEFRENKVSTTRNKLTKVNGTNTENVSQEYRPCINVADINKLEMNNEVLVYYYGYFFIAEKCPYFKIPKYLDKSNEIVEINRKLKKR